MVNNRQLFLTVLEAGKSQIKVLAKSVPDESPLPSLKKAAFSLFLTWLRRGDLSLSYSSDKAIHLQHEGPTLMTSSDPKCLSKYYHIGVMAQHMNLVGDTVQHIADSILF